MVRAKIFEANCCISSTGSSHTEKILNFKIAEFVGNIRTDRILGNDRN